jgi:hypothetical protein
MVTMTSLLELELEAKKIKLDQAEMLSPHFSPPQLSLGFWTRCGAQTLS